MTLVTRRPWRSRARPFRPAQQAWFVPIVSLYWRQRRRAPGRGTQRLCAATHPRPAATVRSRHEHLHTSTTIANLAKVAAVSLARTLGTRLVMRILERRVVRATHTRETAWGGRARGSAPVPEARGRENDRPAGSPKERVLPKGVRPPAMHRAARLALTSTGASQRHPVVATATPMFARRSVQTMAVLTLPVPVTRHAAAAAVEMRVPPPASAALSAATFVHRVSAPPERAAAPVTLEWRTPLSHRGDQHSLAVETARGTTARTPAIQTQTATAAIEGPSAPKPALPKGHTGPLPFDPSTMDRLADNVIQRIERRVRVERERRGL